MESPVLALYVRYDQNRALEMSKTSSQDHHL